MAKGWSKRKRCPICDGPGWGNGKCRGFEHQDGGAVYCENPDRFLNGDWSRDWERTDVVIEPLGIPVYCFRRKIS